MEIIERIRKGELALRNNSTVDALQKAVKIVWPSSFEMPNGDCLYYFSDKSTSSFWDADDKLPEHCEGMIDVSYFLSVCCPDEVVDNPEKEPEAISVEEEYDQKLTELKQIANLMGKTVKVKLEDKYKYEIMIDVLEQPSRKEKNYARVEIYNSTPIGAKDVPFDVFMDSLNINKDHIAKAIEDILNGEV